LSAGLAPAGVPADLSSPPKRREAPRAADGRKFLQQFVGEWDVAQALYPVPGAEPIRQKGTCRQQMIHRGLFLQSDFTFQSGSTTTTGQGLIGFDAATGTFTSAWADSRSARLCVGQSKDRFDGKQIVIHGRCLSGGKETGTLRTVTHLEEEGRRIVHRLYGAGEGGKERLRLELVLTRK
jgi:hypothetical protein